MRQLTQEGLPKFGRGTYPLAGCVQWYVAYWEKRAKGRMGNADETEGQQLKNALARAKLQEATGHLIPRKDVVNVQTSAYLRLGKWFDGLASSLAREFNWNGDTTKVLRARLDEARNDFANDVAEYLDPAEKAKDDAARTAKRA